MSAVSTCPPSIKPEEEPLDMGTLCANLSFTEGTAAEAANRIINSAPDLLLEIGKYKKPRLLELFEKSAVSYDRPDRLRAAVLILYSNSLTNSHYRKSVENLENTIQQLLVTSDISYARKIIEKVSFILSQEPGSALEAIQEQLKQARIAATEIENFLKLFYYLDSKDEIENIYRFTQLGDYSQFPHCETYFPPLCQNLSICQKEKEELLSFRRQLVQKIALLVQKQAAFCAEVSAPKLSIEKAKFLEYHGALLWEMGSALLTEAFNQTLTQKKNNPRLFIPQDLVNAINAVSRKPGFKGFYFRNLIERRSMTISIQYISQVWSEYTGSDLLSLMQHSVEKVSDATFAEMKEGKPEALKAEICGQSPLTFMKLRDWLVENRPNS